MTGARRISGWALFWIYSIVVIRGAVLPPDEIPGILTQINDKIIHAVEFFLLFFFAVHALNGASTPALRAGSRLWSWGYCLVMGLFTEWLQFHVPGRDAQISDLAADIGGASLALLLFTAFQRAKMKSRDESSRAA